MAWRTVRWELFLLTWQCQNVPMPGPALYAPP